MKGRLVIKQTWKHFAFTCAVLGKVMNASLSLAEDTGKLLGPRWIGRLASAGIKSCAMIAVLTLSIASSGAGQTATKMAEQAQAKPTKEQAQAAATQRPTEVERESWRRTILKTPRPKPGCFTASYPETEWREVRCKTPPHKLYPPKHGIRPDIVGRGTGFSAEVTGHISESEGSFDSVTGVTSESSSNGTANAYSLQLNTEPFTTQTCNGSPDPGKCFGWEQFVYSSTSGDGFIQYWLLNYGPGGTACPTPRGASCVQGESESDGWCPFTTGGKVYCVVNAMNSAPAPSEPITSLGQLKLTGAAAGVAGAANDSIAVTVGGTPYTASGNNYFPDLGSQWQEVEFNVFGDGDGDQANFNSGSTIVVRAGVASGTTSGPGCAAKGFTGETNNLTLDNTPPAASVGALPALVFSESNPAPSGAAATCADATSVGDTHLTTFDGLYYDFQASGDFVLAQDGSDFVVQTRQASGAPTWPNASVNKAVATQMGKTRVAIYIEPTRLVIDGAANDLADGKSILLPTGVQISRHGNLYVISSESGDRVRATLNSTWIDVNVGLGHAPLTEMRGLLGNPKGNAEALETSDGVVLKEPVSFTDLYHTYADSWRVQPRDSLFSVETTIRPGIPDKPFFASNLDPKASAKARAACKAAGITVPDLLESCTLDTTVLNDKTAAKVFVHARPPRVVIKPVLRHTP